MSLDVWASLEGHMKALNRYDISIQFFLGFNAVGPGSGDIKWSSMSEPTKRWWVAYLVARIAPFANLGGLPIWAGKLWQLPNWRLSACDAAPRNGPIWPRYDIRGGECHPKKPLRPAGLDLRLCRGAGGW
eukprot:SAG25_NODE_2592_length_1510_cov_1.105599_2_plen_130_part_00